jgi:choline monooxygenase
LADAVYRRLEEGFTPTAAWYSDPALFALEMDRVFGRTWQLVGTTAGLDRPGAYTTVTTAGGREFIVVQGDDGQLRGFHNVCRHRANPLLEGHGACAMIQCGYHAWTYRLDGQLHASPGVANPAFDRARFGLRQVSVGVMEPFLFLNPNPAAEPLEDHLGDLPDQVRALGVDMATVARSGQARTSEYEIRCNWKVAVENSLECYHCPTSHPGLRATLDLSHWQVEMQGMRISQGGRLRPVASGSPAKGESTRLGPTASTVARSPQGNDLAWFHWIFPNNSISIWPGPGGSFNIGRWIPMTPDLTRWWRIRCWPDDVPVAAREEQWAFISQVNVEDQRIVEGIQRGISSGAWDGSVLSLAAPGPDGSREQCRDERGVQRFNALVAAALLRA